MPKFMKDKAILLIEGAIESYLLGLYGLNILETKNPQMKIFRNTMNYPEILRKTD